MKKRITAVVILLAVIASSIVYAFAGAQDFTIVNRTGVTIWRLYVSASNESSWEEDVLRDQVLNHGERKKIRFSNTEYRQYWDLKIEDRAGNSFYWRNIDLFSVYKITLYQRSDGSVYANFN